MTQSNVLRVCRWLGYLSLCLFLCSWLPGCGGGTTKSTTKTKPDQTDKSKQSDAKKQADDTDQQDDDTLATGGGVQSPGDDETLPPAELTEASFNAQGFSKFDMLMAALSIFVLAIFVGFEVITKVPPTLHTPLMSGSNAISGITLVGALLVAGRSDYAAWLGVLAVVFATINVIGGFWVTHRMLSMFQR